MFEKVDLGRRISGAELGAMLKCVAEERGGKYGAWIFGEEDALVLGSVRTGLGGGILGAKIEFPYTAMRDRFIQSRKVTCYFGEKTRGDYGDRLLSIWKDHHYEMVGLNVIVAVKPIGWGRAIAWIPIFGWLWSCSGYIYGTYLSNFSPEHQAQVENDVVRPLLSDLGDLLKSTTQPSSV